ncbi:MAG: OmpA/MotB domain protein [Deltaproteobacteria bacterium]|nr:OmpA/MotB domain protein [Deltaproteobacteria bacterium]
MLIQRIFFMLGILLACGTAFAAGEADLRITSVKPGVTVKIDNVMRGGKLLINVVDSANKPLFGQGPADFRVTQAGRTAKILSVQPIAESLDVPRNIVLVLDNSYSMEERNAVKSLLAGVGELLKTVRPIDRVQIVVFDSKQSIKVAGRELRVKIFASSQPAELLDFVEKAYSTNALTAKTVLYEAMLAGLDLIGKMPAGEPRFMVVFTDGEDLNSSYNRDDVLKAAHGIEGFNAYAIDYMEGAAIDKFLSRFANENRGQIWKAETESNLVDIFQSVASKMQYYYVVTYLFPTTGTLAVAPAALTFDEIRTADAVAPAAKTSKAPAGGAPATETALVAGIDASALTLRPVIDSPYAITSWKVTVSNARGTVAGLAGEGAPAAELTVPLPTADLQALAAGGELSVTMAVEDGMGQSLVLNTLPVKIKVAQTRASLAVVPASLTFDEITVLGAAPDTRINQSVLTLLPVVDKAYGTTGWKVAVSNARGSVAGLAGEGAPAAELKVQLPVGDPQALAAGGDLAVKMELQNARGQNLVLKAAPVKVNLLQTRAGLAIAPASLTIEEIKTIDASPMLGQIYFDKGSSEIPSRYVRFSGAEETAGFDEQKFRDTLEKYYQLLNIVGKRLVDNAAATIRLVGCNDNIGEEKGKKTLSSQRAEAVKNYLQTVWSIAPERMSIEARNLPVTPSTSKSREGQAENRRVEIQAADPAILAPIRSTYLTTRIDAPALTLSPDVVSPHGIDSWTITAANSAGKLADLSGKGAPAKETKIPLLGGGDLKALAEGGDISVKMALQDRKGQRMMIAPAPVKVNFIETSKRLAQKQDQRVQEKYALILFDFDKDTIGGANQEIINKIVTRLKALPQANVEIVGHTDNIGKEAYNIKLSERRALAVNKLLVAAYGEKPGDRIRHSGVGPHSPLYENVSPETRSFNRTVTITLEYLSAE